MLDLGDKEEFLTFGYEINGDEFGRNHIAGNVLEMVSVLVDHRSLSDRHPLSI